MRLLLFAVVLASVACSNGSPAVHGLDGGNIDGPEPNECGGCNPLTQTGCPVGEKCTWAVDQFAPQYIGHIDCVGEGTIPIGGACTYMLDSGSGGCPWHEVVDHCMRGAVCSSFRTDGSGVCKQICDNLGGNPMCDATQACVVEPGLFSTGASTPAAAGLCEAACDPLADNDFDGSGSALSRTGSACGSATVGCYGAPSQGTPPRTAFTCMPDLHYGTSLVHRSECTSATGCADAQGAIAINSCNQGYEPLFAEATGNTTAVCIALCKPVNCYAGHCGSNDSDAHGAAPHRCENPDALGRFGSDENCEYLWREELDGSGNFLPSPSSDAVGVCFDHSKYKYDPNMGTNPTIPYPPCEQLQLHATGTDPNQPLTYLGAADLGCVDSGTAGHFTGKPSPVSALGFRLPYHC